jgi:CRP-like cAMP-binding protein
LGSADLNAFRKLIKVSPEVRRGEIIASTLHAGRDFAVLLGGLACMTTRHEDGARQIFAFHHPGDFLALYGLLYSDSAELIEVEALSNCSIGTIDRGVLEQAMQGHPELGQALWWAAMMEANILRQRLVMARWPAQQRVAHLLCEQLARRPGTSVIPLSQIEVADAAGLSVVHTNRSLQDLRRLGVLAEERRIEVVNKVGLQKLARFDGRYLAPRETLSRWDLRIEE